MKALLENIDLFAHKINFNYKKKNLYHSFFGIGLSFMLYGVMIYFVNYFSRDFIHKSNPRVIYQETEFENNIIFNIGQLIGSEPRSLIQFSSSELLFNLTENKNSRDIVSDDILKIIIHQHHSYNETGNLYILRTKAFVYMEKRKLDNQTYYLYTIDISPFKNFTVETYFNKSLLGDFYDKKIPNETPKITKFNETNISVSSGDKISIGIVPGSTFIDLIKSNNTDKLDFIPTIKIKNYIMNVNTEAFFKAYHLDEYPLLFSVEKTGEFDKQYSKYNFGVIGLKDDTGFIFSEFVYDYGVKLNYESIEKKKSKFYENYPNYLHELTIDRLFRNYDRIYKKLQNVFADLGGILHSFILIGNIIVVQFNKMKFDYDLINKVFKAEKDYEWKNNKEKGINSLRLKTLQNNQKSSIVEMSTSRNFMEKPSNNQQIPLNDLLYKNHKNESTDNQFKLNKNQNKIDIDNSANNLDKKNTIFLINDRSVDEMNVNKDKDEEQTISLRKPHDLNIGKVNSEKDLKDFLEKFKNEELFDKPLKLTKLDFFNSFICCRKFKNKSLLDKEKVFQQAQSQIYEYMDIVNYVLLFEKINNIISIMFNECESYSFNFIKNRKINEIYNERINEEDTKKVIDYYKDKIRNSKMNLNDNRIINSFYSSFRKLIAEK